MTTTLVSDLIRSRRDAKGLTQGELADKLEVARNTVNRWENADSRSKPELASRKKLARILGGKPEDYEWKDADYDRAVQLQRIKDEAAALVRKLLSGE